MKPNIQSKIIFSVNGKEETRDVKEYAYTIYDKEGRSIYTNTFYRIECWWEYNKAGKMIHFVQKHPNGKVLEKITKFNEAGKKIYYRNDFEGPTELFYNYTEDGKLLSVTNKNGGGRFLEYNSDGKLVYQYRKTSKGKITWEEHYQYDENGNIIREKVEDTESDSEIEEEVFQKEDFTTNIFSDDKRYLILYEDGIIKTIREKIENGDDTVTVISYKV